MVQPLAAVILFLVSGSLSSGQKNCADPVIGVENLSRVQATLQGYWGDRDDPSYALAVEGTRLIVANDALVRDVAAILSYDGQNARICFSGRETTAALHEQGGELIFRDPFRERTHHLTKLRERPAGLCLTAFRAPDPQPLSRVRIAQIQRELYERSQKDQALLRPTKRLKPSGQTLPWLQSQSSGQPEAAELDGEIRLADELMKNNKYMRDLISEVGWIDAERFGYGASNAAFLLVQHSWDVSLMLAVLPRLKRDVDAGRMESDTYALLYDRLQLALGLPQRYGTQIVRDGKGEAIVLPIEDRAHVEEFRRQLGLIPLADYVKVFGASEVRFSPACQTVQASD